VAPLDNNDQLPSWANYGAHTVDLAAPGVSIYSTLRGGAYGYLSGSSMAAPQVAGAAALILSVAPSLPAAALKAAILENVDHLPALAGRVISGGALDVCKALPGCSKLAPKPPTSTSAPTISGPTALGGTLTEAHGAWTGEATSFVYQWMRCDASGNNCQPIIGATGQTYAPAAGDVGHALRALETAINAGGASNPASSAATAPVVGALPVNTARPSISGWAYVGQTLGAGPGRWSEYPSTYAYQWQRCDSQGNSCVAISLATTASYTVVGADAGSTLRVTVVASNAVGSSVPASSARTESVPVPRAPINVSPPTISGSPVQGQTLTEAHGTWAGEPSSLLYRWLRCDPSGGNCQLLSSATQAYTLVAGDVGHTLRALEAASNAGGTGYPAISAASAVVVGGRPVNTARPIISGATSVGQTLSASTGSFSENPTGYVYQWQRCDSQGSNCAAIASATTQSYTAGEADVGATLRVVVVAANAAGPSAPAISNSTPAVSWQRPANTSPPSISGRAQSGQTLTASPGTWTGAPSGYAYQWQRCDASGGNCQAIAGASGTTYLVRDADVESRLRVLVSASNPSGQPQAAASGPTEVVGPAQAPTNTAAPTISGTATQGQALTEVHGSWTGEPTSYAYQWLRCDAAGSNCQQLFGATGQTYVPLAGDVGHTLRVQETATNAAGSSSPEGSGPSGTVAPQENAATFGKTTVGAFADGGLFSDYKVVHSASLAAAGSVIQLSVYAVPGINSPSPQSVKAVIYADSGGAPGALLATGTEVVYRGNLNGSGWLDLPLASPLALQPGTYWIGFITGPTTEGMGYAYDSVESSRAYNANAYSSGPSEPFGEATLDSEQASIYATYVPGA
jgi:Subtilase family